MALAASSDLSAGVSHCGPRTVRDAALLFVKSLERTAWFILAAVMLLVLGVYIGSRPPSKPLPEIARVGDFALTNQFGVPVRLRDLGGNVVIANVIFTRCPGQCHQLSQSMRRIQQGVPRGLPVRFVSLTADPLTDTPDILRKYAERYGADGSTWNFLTGPKVDVYRLAIEGMKFSVVENPRAKPENLEEQFIHSSSFAIIDRRGSLRAMIQMEDPNHERRILEIVGELAKESWK